MRKLNLIPLLFICFQLCGQSIYGVGQWRYHFPYNQVDYIEQSGNYVYAGNAFSTFIYDRDDNSLTPFSKIDGLGDFNTSATFYSPKHEALILGYESGTVDIVFKNEIITLKDIVRAELSGSKKINDITVNGDIIYLSTAFGVTTYNLAKNEFGDTFKSIGINGKEVNVITASINDDLNLIFLLTTTGLQSASLSSNNLLDFNSWSQHEISENLPTLSSILSIESIDKNTYLISDSGAIYLFNIENNTWDLSTETSLPEEPVIKTKINNNKLIITQEKQVNVIDQNNKLTTYPVENKKLLDAIFIDNKLWLGTTYSGIVEYDNLDRAIYINGPLTNKISSFGYHDDTFYAFPGSMKDLYTVGFYQYQNQGWSGSNNRDIYNLPSISDIAFQKSTGRLFLASNNYGLLVKEPTGSYTLINDTTKILSLGSYIESPIQNYWPRCRFLAAETDVFDNTWFINYGHESGNNLFCFTPLGEFIAFEIRRREMIYARDLKLDNYGKAWIMTNAGIVIYDYETNESINVSSGNKLRELPTTIASDKNGDIWVGTTKGISIFYDPRNVFTDINYEATSPIVGTQPLLYSEYINCIYVDGGNRKWIGTSNGVWLVSPDGNEEILHFNKDNSPLPSNEVTSIGVNENTGEVFFALQEGIVSFWGDATNTEDNGDVAQEIRIFPNPVKPGYQGEIGITGLPENASVKITNISGNLVLEKTANGGMISWDGKDINGNNIKTGVYLVYSASQDGENSLVGKLVVVE